MKLESCSLGRIVETKDRRIGHITGLTQKDESIQVLVTIAGKPTPEAFNCMDLSKPSSNRCK